MQSVSFREAFTNPRTWANFLFTEYKDFEIKIILKFL